MVTRILLLAAMVPVLAALIAGCGTTQMQNDPIFGTVVGVQPGITGSQAARAVMVDVEGQVKPLSRLYGNATLLVFLNEPCGSVEAEVLKPSPWIGYDVNLITVTSSPGACAAQQVCVPAFQKPMARVVSLCDSGNVLRHIFSVGPEGGVLLLDEVGFVVSHGTLEQYGFVRSRTPAVARDSQAGLYMLLTGGGASGIQN